MWVSQWLYEKLPYLYLLSASATLAIFGLKAPGSFSAGALFVAAFLTYTWRWQHRKNQAQAKSSEERLSDEMAQYFPEKNSRLFPEEVPPHQKE